MTEWKLVLRSGRYCDGVENNHRHRHTYKHKRGALRTTYTLILMNIWKFDWVIMLIIPLSILTDAPQVLSLVLITCNSYVVTTPGNDK